MNITKKLIELQNGEIEVKSKPKQGSEFTFTIDYYIPKNNGVSHQISGKTNVSKSVTLKNKNILLVEDNLINQKVAVSFLNFWEINCDIANNGKEALDMLELKHYDLVLMDIFMPIMDGFEAIKNIRKNKLFADLPIIALTASAELSIMNKVLSLGANQYLMKPFNPEQLQDSLLDLLGNGKNESTIWVKNQGQVEENQNFEIINLKLLKETSFNSNDFILEMLNLVLIEVPIIISNAETCLQNEKYELFSNSIHKLKSTLLLIGIEKLHADLNFMETFSKKNENISEVKLRFISLIDTWKLAIDEIQLAIKQING